MAIVRAVSAVGIKKDSKLRRPSCGEAGANLLSGIGVNAAYSAVDLDASGEGPGEYPFTRGIHRDMYRGRTWTMRQFAGFGSARDTNRRFHYLLAQGQQGLSTAFDMPTLMGYDPDSPRSLGEVGREGVSVATIDDLELLFEGIDLGAVTTSMTVNCTAPILLAMYVALADRRGIPRARLGGTLQNDMLKEFIAQKEWISPPAPSMRLVTDVIEFCSNELPRWNPVSISGYHIREAGATAVQELAFTLADGIGYVQAAVDRGLDPEVFGPRLSFFFNVHNDFLQEIAKIRAARRMWASIMRDRFGARSDRACLMRTHAQTSGVSLTAQQPLNNVARVALQAMAAVLAGVQSLHTNSLDETLALPSEEAVTVALRTQQIIAEETGVAATVDPFGGSYAMEAMTDAMESEANAIIERIDQAGGILAAVEAGYPQQEIAESAWKFQKAMEQGEYVTVGVNAYSEEPAGSPVETLSLDSEVEKSQVERVIATRASRDASRAASALAELGQAARSDRNMMPPMVEAVDACCSIGEISDIFRREFGVYNDPAWT